MCTFRASGSLFFRGCWETLFSFFTLKFSMEELANQWTNFPFQKRKLLDSLCQKNSVLVNFC